MHKFFVTTVLAVGLIAIGHAQDPVHFSYEAKKISDKQFELHITAILDDGWHIYAQNQPKEAISQPTVFAFVKSPLISFQGSPKETGKREAYTDATAGITQYQYSGKVEFIQPFTRKSTVKTAITGTVTYQACTGEKCLQPKTLNFSVPVP